MEILEIQVLREQFWRAGQFESIWERFLPPNHPKITFGVGMSDTTEGFGYSYVKNGDVCCVFFRNVLQLGPRKNLNCLNFEKRNVISVNSWKSFD